MKDNVSATIKASASDHLANERTFLAWIRTGIALMGFGFVVVKFALFVKQVSFALGNNLTQQPSTGYSAQVGILLVSLGALVSLLSYFRYRSIERKLYSGNYSPSFGLSLTVTLAVLVVSALLIVYLMPQV